MNLWPVDGPGGGYGAQVDSNGNFTFAGVRDGRYRLTPPDITSGDRLPFRPNYPSEMDSPSMRST